MEPNPFITVLRQAQAAKFALNLDAQLAEPESFAMQYLSLLVNSAGH